MAALVASWPGYALVATGAMAIWLMQSAFSAGPLHASLPAITAAEPLAGIVLGIVVFGDTVHITPWLLALQAAGLTAIVAGVILVARAPVFRGLHAARGRAHAHQEQSGGTGAGQPGGSRAAGPAIRASANRGPPGHQGTSQPAGDTRGGPPGTAAPAAAGGSRLVRAWGLVLVAAGIPALRGRVRRRLT